MNTPSIATVLHPTRWASPIGGAALGIAAGSLALAWSHLIRPGRPLDPHRDRLGRLDHGLAAPTPALAPRRLPDAPRPGPSPRVPGCDASPPRPTASQHDESLARISLTLAPRPLDPRDELARLGLLFPTVGEPGRLA